MRVADDEAVSIGELRALLNEWDPIGVFGDESDGPADEYDCLYYPLLGRLKRGESEREIADFLRDELQGHFGLTGAYHPFGFAARLVAWWASRS